MNIINRFLLVFVRHLRKSIYRKTGFDILNKSKIVSPSAYFLDIDEKDLIGFDIRKNWEYNRFQWLVIEVINQNSKGEYSVRRLCNIIIKWIKENPVGYGYQWLCPMEAAIRATNWLIIYEFIKDNTEMAQDFRILFFKCIEEHGKFIEQNLEVSVRWPLSNHYLTDVAGLLYIGICCPQLKRASHWKKFALKEIQSLMEHQVLTDGVWFENSTFYHRYVLEVFLYSAVLCQNNGIQLSNSYWNKLEKMLEFVMYYTRPDGVSPQIGDSDDGLFRTFSKDQYDYRDDHRYLLALGAVIFKRKDFKHYDGMKREEVLRFFGEDGLKIYEQIGSNYTALESRAFSEGGIYIMRSNEAYLFVTTDNSYSHSKQLHKHSDILSFELCIGDDPVFIDLGTYCYTATPKWRNFFRSTEAHNVVRIDKIEQQDLNHNNFFAVNRQGSVKVIEWITDGEKDIFEASYDGYKKLSNPVIYTRKIYFNKKEIEWTITDEFSGIGEHLFEWFFHCHPDLQIELIAHKKEVHIPLKKNKLILQFDKIQNLQIKDSWVSFRYGEKKENKVITANIKCSVPFVEKITIKVVT